MKKGTKVDMSSTWIYKRGLNTSTCYNTHILHKTPVLLYPDDRARFDRVWPVCLIVTPAASFEGTSM